MIPKSAVVTSVNQIEVRRFFFTLASCPTNMGDDQIDQLDSKERSYDATYSIDEQVPLQQRRSTERTVWHATKGQRNEANYDQRVEDHGRQNCRLGCLQPHNI